MRAQVLKCCGAVCIEDMFLAPYLLDESSVPMDAAWGLPRHLLLTLLTAVGVTLPGWEADVVESVASSSLGSDSAMGSERRGSDMGSERMGSEPRSL